MRKFDIKNQKDKWWKMCLSGAICMLFLFVCLSFNFPLNLLKTNEQENENQISVNDIIMFAVASEDTGASSAPSSEKGGCHYLGAGTKMTMSEGTITGTSKKYGGAVYISSGATFTMSGGTISGCTARYGGAIYVASGGTLNMAGGTIEECGATYAPAIYVEENATVTINGEIIDCFYGEYYLSMADRISSDTIMVGDLTNGVQMHYMDYGTYPQTYVGDTMNTALENWYSSSSPTVEQTYILKEQTWLSYKYTDGNYYARGSSYPNSARSFTYVDGTTVKSSGAITWFKVEPIRWIVLNYDAVQAGTATTIDCLSYLGVVSGFPFGENWDTTWDDSYLKSWLNQNFLIQAFTAKEQADISGVYCISQTSAFNYLGTANKRLCSPTDFALSNGSLLSSSYCTAYRPDGGVYHWWGSDYYFTLDDLPEPMDPRDTANLVRPAISFTI